MNYYKIQADLLKASLRDSVLATRKLIYMHSGRCFYLIANAYVVVIPDDQWLLDTEKVFKNKIPANIDFKRFINDVKDIKLTNERKLVDDRVLIRFINDEKQHIYIDEKFLKIFQTDKYEKLSYKGTTPRAPIFIYNDLGEWLGLILPVNHKDD